MRVEYSEKKIFQIKEIKLNIYSIDEKWMIFFLGSKIKIVWIERPIQPILLSAVPPC